MRLDINLIVNILTKISAHHDEWIKYARKMGAGELSEDVVQNTYLRINKYGKPEKLIKDNGKINKTYVWVMIRNCFCDEFKENSKLPKVQLENTAELDSIDQCKYKIKAGLSFGHKLINALYELDSPKKYPYDRNLFLLYRGLKISKDQNGEYLEHNELGPITMRKLAEISNISLRSINDTIVYCRERLKESLGEDYEDMLNQDFEII